MKEGNFLAMKPSSVSACTSSAAAFRRSDGVSCDDGAWPKSSDILQR